MKKQGKKRYLLKAQVVSLRSYRRTSKQAEEFTHIARMVDDQGRRFHALVKDFDEICRVGRMTPAMVELDMSPFPESFHGSALIERISRL